MSKTEIPHVAFVKTLYPVRSSVHYNDALPGRARADPRESKTTHHADRRRAATGTSNSESLLARINVLREEPRSIEESDSSSMDVNGAAVYPRTRYRKKSPPRICNFDGREGQPVIFHDWLYRIPASEWIHQLSVSTSDYIHNGGSFLRSNMGRTPVVCFLSSRHKTFPVD
jgi:hypothetical protein